MAQDIPVTINWQSEKRCEALTTTAAGTGACEQLIGRCWKWGQGTWLAKTKQGRWLTMWLIIVSDCGISQGPGVPEVQIK